MLFIAGIMTLSVVGLVATLASLAWLDLTHVSGALFGNMFVLDRMALFFKMFVMGATILVILASIEYVHRFTFFRGEYYFLVLMSALGMMFMASANDLLSVFVTLEFSTFGFYVLVAYLREHRIALEICPTSNLRTGALARQLRRRKAGLRDHPLPQFFRAGIPVVLATDDPALFETTLVREYEQAARLGLSVGELRRLAAMSFRAAFLPERARRAMLRRFRAAC